MLHNNVKTEQNHDAMTELRYELKCKKSRLNGLEIERKHAKGLFNYFKRKSLDVEIQTLEKEIAELTEQAEAPSSANSEAAENKEFFDEWESFHVLSKMLPGIFVDESVIKHTDPRILIQEQKDNLTKFDSETMKSILLPYLNPKDTISLSTSSVALYARTAKVRQQDKKAIEILNNLKIFKRFDAERESTMDELDKNVTSVEESFEQKKRQYFQSRKLG